MDTAFLLHTRTQDAAVGVQQVHLLLPVSSIVTTQSKVVAQLTLLAAITVLHRSCSVAPEPLHR